MPRATPLSARATIKDVAAAAGVSIATVSRVLAGRGGAGDAVQNRIRSVVAKLGYRPNLTARGLRVRQRTVVGLILPNLQNPFFTAVAHGVEEHLAAHGYTLLLGHSAEAADRERRNLEVFRAEGVAGLVLVPCNAAGADYAALGAWEMPIVAVDRAPTGLRVDLVNTDNRAAAAAATAHLLRLGYASLALINGPRLLDVSRARLAGVRDALAAQRKSVALTVISGDFTADTGAAAMRELLRARKRPRAVIVGNNLMTLGALEAIHAAGLRIPQDVALIGFDDMPWATSLRPPLTAVAQPATELGRTAAALLLDRLSAPARPVRTVTLANQLNIRASCGA